MKNLTNDQTLNILKKKAQAVNRLENFNKATSGLYWENFKKAVKFYFAKTKTTEISFRDFSNLTGLGFEASKKMLIEINKDIFNK
jgi:hypothetical protein